MEGVGSRLGRASARYGPTQTVFSGPVRKWKKRWVHVSSSSSTLTKSNGHNNSNGNGASLLLCKWTPLSPNPSDSAGTTPEEEPPKRRFRYTPVAVLEEQKRAGQEKDEDEESETNEANIGKALTKETQDLNLGMCLKGPSGDHNPGSHTKDNQLIKSAIDDLF